jgi:Protein of unknown function (DUF3108)
MPRLHTSPIPLRHLLALVALVLCAHALLLSGDSTAWNLAQRKGTALSVRSIAAALPAPTPVLPTPVESAAPVATMAKTPVVKKRLPPPIEKPLNRPVAPSNSAQEAPENIVVTAPQIEPIPPPPAPVTTPEPVPTPATSAEALAQAVPVSDTSTTSVQATASPSIEAASSPTQATSIQAASASAGTDPALELKFPPSGSFAYAATLVRGVQPQTGSGTLEWTSDGRAYQMRLVSSALFITLLSQTSVGQLGADGLLPERFGDKRFNRSEKAAHFNRIPETGSSLGRITFSGNQRAVAIQRGAQDRLSVLVQLAGLVAANPAQFAVAGNVAVQVVSAEGADVWKFVLQGEELLQLPAGKATTLHLVRNPRQEYDPRLELWLAPELGYLPVRIKQTEANGDTFDLQLRSPALKQSVSP